jgi:hypothetical protein
MAVPREVPEIRQLLADPHSLGEDGKLRPEVHALIDELSQQIGHERTLASVRDPSGVD